MRRTFNCGVGFVFVVGARDAERALALLREMGEAPVRLGDIIPVPSDRAFEERVEWPE